MGKKKKHTLGPNNTYMSFGPMLHPFSSFAGMWGHGMGLGEGVGGVGGGVVVVVVGLVKKEESFDCPALSFFDFDPPVAVDVPVRGRLRDSWDDSCDSLREV